MFVVAFSTTWKEIEFENIEASYVNRKNSDRIVLIIMIMISVVFVLVGRSETDTGGGVVQKREGEKKIYLSRQND
jgi:hypothetical protein